MTTVDAQNRSALAALEPGQYVRATATPLPKTELTNTQRKALWALRIFTLALAAMVVWTFIAQL
jgi:hypothetical protein